MSARTDLTPEQRILRARMGGYARAANAEDPRTLTAAATKGAFARFERQVDPESALPAEERTRRAKAAQRAYMAGLALKRSRTASKKKEGATA